MTNPIMTTPERVYMLASDHRWQWEEWADGRGVPRARISEVKALVFDAFLLARRRSALVRRFGALLLDPDYAAEPIARAAAEGIPLATPVERAGIFPLEWSSTPFHAPVVGAYAKVLIRYRPEWPPDAHPRQLARMLDLQAWCRANHKLLLVEIVVPRGDEPEDAFERSGRPAMLAGLIRGAYEAGLVPSFWKIEATSSAEGAAEIDRAVRARPEGRQIILGKGADRATIERWFAAAAARSSAAGFAIGRSVFWQPGTAYLEGRMAAEDAVRTMAETYLALIASWEKCVGPGAAVRST